MHTRSPLALSTPRQKPRGSKRHRGDDDSSAPRDPPRTRSEEARAAVDEREEHRRSGRSYAHRAVGASSRSGRGTTREGTPATRIGHSTPFPRIAREGTFLIEGGTEPTRRAPSRGGQERRVLAGTEGGGSAASVRLFFFSFRGHTSSIRGQEEPGPRKRSPLTAGPLKHTAGSTAMSQVNKA